MAFLQKQVPSAAASRPDAPFQAFSGVPNAAGTRARAARSSHAESTSGADMLDRRTVMILTSSLVTSYFQLLEPGQSVAADASSSRGLARYIKKKSLDPLETYVPLVLEARQQLVAAGETMAKDPAAARDLLRTGAFQGLRENIRALGEFAVTNGQAQEASKLVNGFFNALGDYDQLLFAAARQADREAKEAAKEAAKQEAKDGVAKEVAKAEPTLDLDVAQAKLQAATVALDSLLGTVPADVMAKSRAILDATMAKTSSALGAATPSQEDILLRSLLK